VSESINTTFCRIMLQESRKMAKEAGVSVPKGLVTWSMMMGGNRYFEVWDDSSIVWSGDAHNAYEAKSNYITELIESETTEYS